MDDFILEEAMQEFGKGLVEAGRSGTPIEFELILPKMSKAEFGEFARQVNAMLDRVVQ